MKLASVHDVLHRVSLDPNRSGASSSAASALEAATPVLENILGTKLSKGSYLDYYDHTPSVYAGAISELLLFTDRAFLTKSSVEVYLSADSLPIQDISGLTAEASTDYVVDAQKGSINLQLSPPRGRSVIVVKYESGYDDEDSSIPDWLREAAISGAISFMHSQSMTHGKQDIARVSGVLHRAMYAQVSSHIRPRYFGLFPAFSESVT